MALNISALKSKLNQLSNTNANITSTFMITATAKTTTKYVSSAKNKLFKNFLVEVSITS